MPDPTPYEIVIRGRASARLLRPLLDDFTVEQGGDGNTCLAGSIRDPSHLHGLLAHLTSVGAEVVSLARRSPPVPHAGGRPTGPAAASTATATGPDPIHNRTRSTPP